MINCLAGREESFSAEFVKELYSDLQHYRELVTQDAKRLVCDGQILEEDMPDAIELAVARARQAGLTEP